MLVHLAHTGDAALDQAEDGYRRLAGHSNAHVLVDTPDSADLILLTQAHLCADPLTMHAVRMSEAWRHWPDKTFVVDFRDRPWCAFPGLYTSMPASSFRTRWQQPWLYPWIDEGPLVEARGIEPDLLFSFMGARTHPCREHILRIGDARAIVEDTTNTFGQLHATAVADNARARFRDVLARSKFVLCPRGHGTTSFRLQEVLASGRAPVIVSDEWVEPAGPDWSSAAVRWPEGDIETLPSHLASIEDRATAMGAAAARIFDEWFAERVMFDRIVAALQPIDRRSPFPRNSQGLWIGFFR